MQQRSHKDCSTEESELTAPSSRHPTPTLHAHPHSCLASPTATLTHLQPQQQLVLLIQSHLEPEVYIDKQHPIGSGAFSQVYSGFIRDNKQQLIPIVLKECKYSKGEWEQRYTTKYESEVEGLWMLSSCPFAVRLYCAFYSPEQRLCLVLEKCATTLQKSMQTIRGNLNLALQVFTQMIEYLAFAHNIRRSPHSSLQYRGTFLSQLASFKDQFATVIHKDIKPANILVRQLSQNSITITVADLGMAELSPCHTTSFGIRFGGTLRYQSPEMQMRKNYDSRVDCWSFGILARNLFTEAIQLQAMPHEARIGAMKELSSRLQNDLSDVHFSQKEVVLFILEHCLAFRGQKRWHSHQLKTVWDNYVMVQDILSKEKQTSEKTREKLFDLIAIQAKLVEQTNRNMNFLHKKCLQKILQLNRKLVCEILESNSLLVPEVLTSLKFLFAMQLDEDWVCKQQSGQFLFARLKQPISQRVVFKQKQPLAKVVDLMISYTNSSSSLAPTLQSLRSAIADLA